MTARQEWCPTCRQVSLLTPLGVCCWCDTIVALEPDLRRVPHHMTDATVDKAVALYFHQGYSLRETARQVFTETGYASEWSCAMALTRAFHNKGLRMRTKSHAGKLRAQR